MAVLVAGAQIEPVRRAGLVGQVMAQVKHYILENDLRSGDRLPSEKELARSLGVCRNILREGLKSLEAVGLIRIRVGDGTYVADLDLAGLADQVSFAIGRSKRNGRGVAKTLRLVERDMLTLAAQRLDESDVSVLRECVRRLDCAKTDEEAALVELELRSELLFCAGNSVLSEFGFLLDRRLSQVQKPARRNGWSGGSASHSRLIKAIRSGDPERVRNALVSLAQDTRA